jgi:hypothetical protein
VHKESNNKQRNRTSYISPYLQYQENMTKTNYGKKQCFNFERLMNYDRRDLLGCRRADILVVCSRDVVCLRFFEYCGDIVVAPISKELLSMVWKTFSLTAGLVDCSSDDINSSSCVSDTVHVFFSAPKM